MIVVGVDPGLTRCGVGVISLEENTTPSRAPKFVRAQVLTTSPRFTHEDRLMQLDDKLRTLFGAFRSHGQVVVAIERPFFTKHNPNTAMGTAQVMGLVMVRSRRKSYRVEHFTPSQVKTSVTGNGRACKQQVVNAVSILLGLNSGISAPPDAFDALAVALTCTNRGVGMSATSINKLEDAETRAQRMWKDAVRGSNKQVRM
ncbi:MAG: crossover junction endodeoxyribonuclease RuvC [Candidatus Ancillula trichonymphae]|nr:crossover junction endodeoxyribonuclease RuvC [Candidatus Ancillula trichonymphae]